MTVAARERSGAEASAASGAGVTWMLEPDDPAAVPALRRRIMDHLAALAAPGEDLWAAEIVVAELLSNAVAHAGGRAWVTLDWNGPHPRIEVADRGPGFGGERPVRVLAARLPEDPLAEGGRGLFLVSRLARDVRVGRRRSGGSLVVVTLDVRRTPQLPVPAPAGPREA